MPAIAAIITRTTMIFLELPDSADVIDDNADDAEAEAEAEAEADI